MPQAKLTGGPLDGMAFTGPARGRIWDRIVFEHDGDDDAPASSLVYELRNWSLDGLEATFAYESDPHPAPEP